MLSDYHNKFSQKKTYNLNLSMKYIATLKTDEIILSALLTVLILPYNLMYYFKLTSLLNRIFGKDFSFKFVPKFFGYGETFKNEKYYRYDFINNLKLDPRLFSSNIKNILPSKKKKNLIALCIKDDNYNNFKEISTAYSSNIELLENSLNNLIGKGFEINRIGEPSMKSFNFNKLNYKDLSKSKYYLRNYNKILSESNYYIGSDASHGESVELFDTRKCIINSIDHITSSFSFSNTNVIMFKKIFHVKKNKILSIDELFYHDLFDFKSVTFKFKKKEIILLENTKDEVDDCINYFLEVNENHSELDDINKEYFHLRQKAVKNKLVDKSCSLRLSCEFNKYRVPAKFLKQNLFNNDYLNELNNEIRFNNLKL